MPAIAFPTYAYHPTQPAQIVASQAAYDALGSPWALTPYTTSTIAPFDPGFLITDIRLQQLLVEQRVTNAILTQANPGGDDPQRLRADEVLTDAAVTS